MKCFVYYLTFVQLLCCTNANVYGSDCDKPCPTNCKDNTCHTQIGTCFTCKPGWSGIHCYTKCGAGWHGVNCSQPCVGHCRDNTICNHVTGLCDGGCDAGWTGDFCDRVCPSGHYGLNCRESCIGNCLNYEPCDHVSGSCSNGCQEGFVGTHCINECVQSYGENCLYPCSPHCYNQTCDRFNGRCLMGCQDGFYGEMCERGRPENISKYQDMSSSIMLSIGLSISMLFNLIFIGCGILLCRRINSNRLTVSGSLLPCWNMSVYQDTVVKNGNDETSTYQELNISNNAYQNTIIR